MLVYLNLSLVSYLGRPIFDVAINNEMYFMGAPAHAFYGTNSVMLMQPLTLGPQVVSWKLDGPEGAPGNGELITAKNKVMLSHIPKDIKWLALHIYDDDTVEMSLSKGTSGELETERGKRIIDLWESKNAQ